jgi:hypothetical protein
MNNYSVGGKLYFVLDDKDGDLDHTFEVYEGINCSNQDEIMG